MKLQDLSLAQLREIVDGAPEGATHWNSNEKDDCWKYIKYDGADNYSLDDEGNWETSMEFHSHAKHGFLNLPDIRARLAELEAQKDISVTLSAESVENKGVDGSEKITVKLDPAKCRIVDPALAYDEPMVDGELKPDPFQQAKDKQHEEISQGKCGEFMAGYDRGFLTAWNERQEEIDQLKQQLLLKAGWEKIAETNGDQKRELHQRISSAIEILQSAKSPFIAKSVFIKQAIQRLKGEQL